MVMSLSLFKVNYHFVILSAMKNPYPTSPSFPLQQVGEGCLSVKFFADYSVWGPDHNNVFCQNHE